MEQNEQLIGEIMLHNLPKDVLEALRAMASLTYPINDRRSFVDQIEGQLKEPQKSLPSEKVEALNLVRELVTVRDFPILTPVSGLEKIFAHLSESSWEDSFPDLDVPGVGNSIEPGPYGPCFHYRSEFPLPVCAQRACEEFLRRLPGLGWLGAMQAGQLAGEECMRHPPVLPPRRWSPVDPSLWLVRGWRPRSLR